MDVGNAERCLTSSFVQPGCTHGPCGFWPLPCSFECAFSPGHGLSCGPPLCRRSGSLQPPKTNPGISRKARNHMAPLVVPVDWNEMLNEREVWIGVDRFVSGYWDPRLPIISLGPCCSMTWSIGS